MRGHLIQYLTAFFVLLAFLFSSYSAAYSAAASAEEARQFADSMGQHLLQVLNSPGNEGQKKQRLRQLFAENVDIDWMGKFVLGRGWGQTNEEQRARYMQAYRQYLLTRYTTNFSEYTGSKYTITGVKDEGNGQYLVSMQIKSPNAQQAETEAGYRVHADAGGNLKIADIIVEGVSMITTQRSDFNSVLQQKGINALIGDIESKASEEKRSAAARAEKAAAA